MFTKVSWIVKNWQKAMLLLEILELVAESTDWQWDDKLIQGIKDFLPVIVKDFSVSETKAFKDKMAKAVNSEYTQAELESIVAKKGD